MNRMTYEEYLKVCNSPVWENLTYGGQKVQPLTQEEYEAQDSKTQETQ